MVERNTVNILINVRFILRARYKKFKKLIRVSLMVKQSTTDTKIQVQVLYTSNKLLFLITIPSL